MSILGRIKRLMGKRETNPVFEEFVLKLQEIEPAILAETESGKLKEILNPLFRMMDKIEKEHPKLRKIIDKIGYFLLKRILQGKGGSDEKKDSIATIQVLTSH